VPARRIRHLLVPPGTQNFTLVTAAGPSQAVYTCSRIPGPGAT
jgi:hypothetical protein